MAKSVNEVTIIGNLGKDPESRDTKAGTVTNFSVATSEEWKDKDTGEKHERTEWHRVVAFRGLADVSAKYLSKGSKVYIKGKLQTRKWTDKDGIERYTTEIVAIDLALLGSREDGGRTQSRAEPERKAAKPAPAPAPAAEPDLDDDIPF